MAFTFLKTPADGTIADSTDLRSAPAAQRCISVFGFGWPWAMVNGFDFGRRLRFVLFGNLLKFLLLPIACELFAKAFVGFCHGHFSFFTRIKLSSPAGPSWSLGLPNRIQFLF